MAGQGFIAAADPASHTATVFTDPAMLDRAITDHHFVALRPTGEPFTVQSFEGGNLFDGAPSNTWIQGVWYAGQKELLSSYWQAGTIPIPPQAILALPTVPLPEQIESYYFREAATTPEAIQTVLAAQAHPSPEIQAIAQQAVAAREEPNYLLWSAIALGAWLLLR